MKEASPGASFGECQSLSAYFFCSLLSGFAAHISHELRNEV
jgi:hypothetical protein